MLYKVEGGVNTNDVSYLISCDLINSNAMPFIVNNNDNKNIIFIIVNNL